MTKSHDDEHHDSAGHNIQQNVDYAQSNTFHNTVNSLTKIFDGPASLFRGIVERTRRDQPYYHRVYKRVPTVDECDFGDHVCIYEANEQFLRDRKVDKFICQLLADRSQECYQQWGIYDGTEKCKKLDEDSELAHTNYYIKYGELAATANCVDAYMKQKHRLIWQRRNPDKDIVGFEKRNEKLEKLRKIQKEAVNNPHQST